MVPFAALLAALRTIPDPRRAQGRGHRVGCSPDGTVKLMLARIRKRRRSSARRPHAAALTPVISAQIVKACARTARYSLAGR
jgi:hypothetical protein